MSVKEEGLGFRLYGFLSLTFLICSLRQSLDCAVRDDFHGQWHLCEILRMALILNR